MSDTSAGPDEPSPHRFSCVNAARPAVEPLPFGETRFTIESGDCLVLYSDGVIEAQNDADREFGEAGLAAVVHESAAGPADVIVTRTFEAIDRFAGAAPQFDDITMLVVRRL